MLATISGRANYTDPGEKFESIAMMLFQPMTQNGPSPGPSPIVKLFDARTEREMTEQEYFAELLETFNRRNPHVAIEEGLDPLEEDE